VYFALGEYDKTIADCTEAINLDPDIALAYIYRGFAYITKNEFDKAIAESNEAIRLDPGIALAYLIRGTAYLGKNEFDKAIADCTETIRLAPDNAVAYLNRGLSYASKGENNKAKTDLETALRLDPDNADAKKGIEYLRDNAPKKGAFLKRLIKPEYIIPVIFGIIFSFVFRFFSKKKARKDEKAIDPNDFTIRQPKLALKVYIVVTVFFSLIGLILVISELAEGHAEGLPRLILPFSPFLLLGPFLIVLWHRWKIVVNVNQITACSYFGKEKTFTFDYITGVINGSKAGNMGSAAFITAYHEKEKLFKVTEIFAGYKTLVSRLESRNKAEGI
jgi:tetratricopeptide (TPR) repeat protein